MPDNFTNLGRSPSLVGELERTHREHAEERQQLAAAIRALAEDADRQHAWETRRDPDPAAAIAALPEPHRSLLRAILADEVPDA